jgi:hypothetical protein
MLKNILNKIMRNFITEGSTVIINSNNTYVGFTGEVGKVTDIIQNKLYMVDVCGFDYPFTKDALDLI